jgi:TRAP transporter TAXI family solute receptor
MNLRPRAVIALAVALLSLGRPSVTAQGTGIGNKRPVFAGACKVCPWGAVGEVVKDALRFYGYDVLICSSCAQSEGPRLVAGARMPAPPNPAVETALQLSPNQRYPLPGGPVDFGATSVQNLWRAYEGKGAYASERPRRNLRLLATIQAPNYLIAAVKSELGVTDLSQLKAKKWPLRAIVGNEGQEVLNHYGLTRQAIEAAGGHVGSSTTVAERANFDVVVAGGSLGNAPEFNVWYEVSQKYNLTYLQLPEDLLDALAAQNDLQRGSIPNGLLRGIDRPIPTVVRTGHVVFGRDDMPEDFAYLVAKALDEHQDLLQWSHLNFSYNVYSVWKAIDVPLHPGAAKYYRERGYMKN